MSRASSRKERARASPSVALFPFLAVLVCTMGALIVVLIVLTRQAQNQAVEVAAAKAAEAEKDVTDAREMARWRNTEIVEARKKTEQQLAEARGRLGLVEDHARRLREQLAALRSQLQDLDRGGLKDNPGREDLAAERARLEAEIADARRGLEQAETASNRPTSYAIIPYEGPSKTRRRPIYLECRGERIILQPEGVEFSPADFQGRLGPENPLASALRAAREHLAVRKKLDPEGADEPYPLLVVRPDGIEAYYAAREAMKSWGAEFGYELVAADWKLRFPPPDPELAGVLVATLRRARAEQQEMAYLVAMTSGGRERPTYRATPSGIVREGRGETGRSGFGSPPRGTPPEPTASRSGVPNEGRRTGGAKRVEGVIPGRPPEEKQETARGPGEPVVRRPGEWVEYQPPPRPKPEEKKDEKKCMAETRGKNWGLPDATRGAVPVTRPIRMECSADRLAVLSTPGSAPEQVVVLGPRTEDSVDQLVSAVWEHMKPWGIAGRNMYWRPALTVRVLSGGESRFEDLASLLDGSGLLVEKDSR